MLLFHDESCFEIKQGRSWYWGEDNSQILRAKGGGAKLMLSGFLFESEGECGWVKGTELFMEIGKNKDGYFNNARLMQQMEKALPVMEERFPGKKLVFIFDNAPSHRKKAENALNVSEMNVNPGGKQPIIRSTTWNNNVQHMAFRSGRLKGVPKGMKQVLTERRLLHPGKMVKKDYMNVLGECKDFKEEKSILEDWVGKKNHTFLFLPRFYCELNPIELTWCWLKQKLRADPPQKLKSMRKSVDNLLANIPSGLPHKWCNHVNKWRAAYQSNTSGPDASAMMAAIKKKQRSHRRSTTAKEVVGE